jgi:2-keto-4-pentenoate hydratase/2-oxohepta-3-ene-1,7-dioic acid hydratase in catechol pathway
VKLLSFEVQGVTGREVRLGALVTGDADNGAIVDLTAAAQTLFASDGMSAAGCNRLANALVPPVVLHFIQGGARSREVAENSLEYVFKNGNEFSPNGGKIYYSTNEIKHMPAISNPPLLRDFMAFEQHLLNIFPRLNRVIPEQWYQRPVYYKGNSSSIGGHLQDVKFPKYAQTLDLEFEFAAIIGKGGVNISEGSARDHIYGYTIYNDLSARDIQALEMTVGLGPAKGKDFIGAHVLGPLIVTADEISNPYNLSMKATVNGEVWSQTNSSGMHWKFEQMIAYASMDEELQVGEVFGSGTCANGSGAEQDKFLVPGDRIELTIQNLGKLVNTVSRDADFDPQQSKHGGSQK